MSEYTIYLILKSQYMKEMGYDSSDITAQHFLFPSEWNLSEDYGRKIDILVEAINKKILIGNTEKYNESFKNGVYK